MPSSRQVDLDRQWPAPASLASAGESPVVNLLLQDLVQVLNTRIEFVARQAEGLSGNHALLKVRSIEYLKTGLARFAGPHGAGREEQDGVFEGQMTATGKSWGRRR